MSHRKTIAAILGIAIGVWPMIGRGQVPERRAQEKREQQYVRLSRDAKQNPIALETAIVRFAPSAADAKPVTVDLVAAVHVADKSYYRQLNRQFEGYDAVLYELVAPEGTKIPKGGRKGSDNAISSVQKGMKDLLELEFQLDEIDYTRKNFIHADMSPDQFSKSMRDRGEAVSDILARLIGYAIAKQGKEAGNASDGQLLLALFDKNRALALKKLMAEQFEEMEGTLQVLDGPKGSTLIGQRNKAALDVLRKEIDAGKRKIAIFYGGGHMQDMQKRLREEFGLVPESTLWLKAWDLQGGKR